MLIIVEGKDDQWLTR